jgi:hypothetical protein
VFTNAASTCFFSFSAFAFLSPTSVFAVTFAVLAASFASFSNLFASFLADDWSHEHLNLAGEPRTVPALLEFEVGPSTGGGLGTACSDDIVLASPSDLRVGGKRYRGSSRIQFGSSHRVPDCGHVVGRDRTRSVSHLPGMLTQVEGASMSFLIQLSPPRFSVTISTQCSPGLENLTAHAGWTLQPTGSKFGKGSTD